MPKRASALVGILLGTATTAVYLIGSGRSFGYDAAATFANFIATPSLWDAFAVHSVLPTVPVKSVASNDHVLISLISHVIYSTTGSRSEVVYRLLPALAAGGTVGVAATALSRKFGTLAGVSAALYIATVPLFVDNSRDVRGYSLAALCAVLATIMVSAGRWTRPRLVVYSLLMGLAIAAHVFAVVVLVGHVAWMATSPARSRTDTSPLDGEDRPPGPGDASGPLPSPLGGEDRPRLSVARWGVAGVGAPPLATMIRLSPAWLGAALIGVAANANIEIMELLQHGFPPSVFDPTFPRDLVFFLLGAPFLLPLGLWVSTAGLGLWALRAEPSLWASLAVIAIVVAVLWLGLQPAYLYPRFFIFLIPGCAYLMGAAIARWKVLSPVALLGAVAAALSQVAGYTEDPLALPKAAAFIERTHAAGGRVCVIHSDEQVLAAYTTEFIVVTTAEQLSACDVVVVASWNVDLSLRDLAALQFSRRTVLQAYYPAVVLER